MDNLEACKLLNRINGKYIGEKITPGIYKKYCRELIKEVTTLKCQIGVLPEVVKIFSSDILSAEPIDLRHLCGYREIICGKK